MGCRVTCFLAFLPQISYLNLPKAFIKVPPSKLKCLKIRMCQFRIHSYIWQSFRSSAFFSSPFGKQNQFQHRSGVTIHPFPSYYSVCRLKKSCHDSCLKKEAMSATKDISCFHILTLILGLEGEPPRRETCRSLIKAPTAFPSYL